MNKTNYCPNCGCELTVEDMEESECLECGEELLGTELDDDLLQDNEGGVMYFEVEDDEDD